MSLTPDDVASVLAGTLDPNRPVRDECERKLSHAKENYPEFAVLLLQVASFPNIPEHIRQSAAVNFKNFVYERDWNCETRARQFPPHVRDAIKQNIIKVLVGAPEIVGRSLLIAIQVIYLYDSSNKWPQLVPDIMQLLFSNDLSIMVAALRVTRVVTKNLEMIHYAEKERELPESLLPVLLQLFQHILSESGGNAPPLGIAMMMKIILKCLWSATVHYFPVVIRDNEANAVAWLTCMMRALQLPVHTDSMGQAKAPSWQIIKWTGQIVRRWMQVGAVAVTIQPQDLNFTRLFATWEPRFLEIFLTVVRSHQNGIPTPRKPFVLAMEVVTLAVARKTLYGSLHAHIPDLIANNLFAELMFSAEDQEIWDDNPQEFVRRGNDPTSDIYNPRIVAMHLIEVLVKPTKKFHDKTILTQFLAFLKTKLDSDHPPTKYACLYAIAQLKKSIAAATPPEALLSILSTYVAPELRSPMGFLRGIAYVVLSEFCTLLLHAGQPFDDTLNTGLDILFNDKELPVRVQILASLIPFLKKKRSQSVVEPHLDRIVFVCFELMKEVDTDDVIQTLEQVVDKFGNHLASYTSQLANTLVRHFLDLHDQWLQASESTDMEFDNTTFGQYESLATSADATLQTVCTMLVSVSHHKEVFGELQHVLAPLIRRLLDPNSIGYLDGALELLTMVTFHARPVIDCIWELFPLLHHVCMDGGLDYFPQMLAPIDNYICADTERFLRSDCAMRMLEMCANIMDLQKEFTEKEMITGPKLMESLFQHSKSYTELLDPNLPKFLDLIATLLRNKDEAGFSDEFLLNLYHVIVNAMWYNAAATMNYLDSRGITQLFFRAYLSFLGSVHKRLRSYDRKVAILGLSCVIPLVPPAVCDELQHVVWNFIQINHSKYIVDDEEFRRAINEETDDEFTDDEEDEEDLDSEDGEDDPEIWGRAEGNAGVGMVGNVKKSVKYSGGKIVGEDDNQDQDEDEFVEEDYWTVLDDVCESVVFRDVLAAGGKNMPSEIHNVCDYGMRRLHEKKAYEEKVKADAKATRESYEKKLSQQRVQR